MIFYIGHECDYQDVNSLEIEAMQWFDVSELPEDISPATARRIDEYLERRDVTGEW